MSPDPDALGWFTARGHPQLTLLGLAGAGLGLLGGLLWLTAVPIGYGFGALGRRLATLGVIVFAVFERGFD